MKLVATFYLLGSLCFFFQDKATQLEPTKHAIILVGLAVLAAILTKMLQE